MKILKIANDPNDITLVLQETDSKEFYIAEKELRK
jgi:hypothetical protein